VDVADEGASRSGVAPTDGKLEAVGVWVLDTPVAAVDAGVGVTCVPWVTDPHPVASPRAPAVTPITRSSPHLIAPPQDSPVHVSRPRRDSRYHCCRIGAGDRLLWRVLWPPAAEATMPENPRPLRAPLRWPAASLRGRRTPGLPRGAADEAATKPNRRDRLWSNRRIYARWASTKEGHLPVPLDVPLKPGPDRPRLTGYGPIFGFGPGFLGFLVSRSGGVRFPFPASASRRSGAGPNAA
jgi:hypothetical protein